MPKIPLPKKVFWKFQSIIPTEDIPILIYSLENPPPQKNFPKNANLNKISPRTHPRLKLIGQRESSLCPKTSFPAKSLPVENSLQEIQSQKLFEYF